VPNIIPVILSGGSGTRLWPLSRKHYPKQFHKLTGGDYSLLQETALRVRHLSSPIVVCNEDHRFMLAEQLHNIGITPAAILLEPVARNTAPAIALAALKAMELDSESIIAVFPADHVIGNQAAFEEALNCATDAASTSDNLITFGIVPSHAETGYGYIEIVGKSASDEGASNSNTLQHSGVLNVLRFIEKPNLEKAKEYLVTGCHLWNSGMFVFRAGAYLTALKETQPEILASCQRAFEHAKADLDFIRVDRTHFSECPADSIDYAVMEKSSRVRVVPMSAGWNDIGSWRAIWDVLNKTEDGTACIGDVISLDSSNCLIHNTGKDKLIVTIGLNDIVVVDTKNALLVAHKDQVQDVKKAVEQIADTERDEHLHHREVHRPWGSYDSIDFGDRYQVKRIRVKPGAALSLQMHHHRAEHWVVVSGTAVVRVNDQETLLTENQSVYIPLGAVHRLTNPGKVSLELIEVQSGSYLGEDDIVRFEDNFGRV
jgi:mannose-1-phosphate guanylyltransferase/mannose-6-phosphate isomerase